MVILPFIRNVTHNDILAIGNTWCKLFPLRRAVLPCNSILGQPKHIDFLFVDIGLGLVTTFCVEVPKPIDLISKQSLNAS